MAVFLLYTSAVFLLAWVSHRRLAGPRFLSEYFLGNRGLGALALALTFGATSASAGSFAGFPSLIYTHGWSLALWISSYMVFPLCGLGLLGKRLNQVSRRAGAITVPDVLRERFDSPALGVVSTLLLALMLTVYLIPQCTLGALICEQLLGRLPAYHAAAMGLAHAAWLPAGSSPEYTLGLLLFAVLVVAYTTFGGFRAVVWTDVLQGFVMLIGVLAMLVLALSEVGGLDQATAKLRRMTTPRLGEVSFVCREPAPGRGYRIPTDTWLVLDREDGAGKPGHLVRTNQTAFILEGQLESEPVKAVEVTSKSEIAEILGKTSGRGDPLPAGVTPKVVQMREYQRGAGQPGVYLSLPGPSSSEAGGFLPIGVAISFFAFWALSGTGQPGNMVRLMAFRNSGALKRSIAILSVYFSLIYFPLVVIFCTARVLAPGLDQTPDRIMPVLTFQLTGAAGVPWLAGLIIAAPFAAAMSTVDSFMLMISSSLVRDIYQRNINPRAKESSLRRMSYACTLVIGLVATAGALDPPRFLQYLVVFVSGGLSVAFLTPVSLALYWPRFNRFGALAAMLGGLGMYLGLYVAGFVLHGSNIPLRPCGLDPLIWGFLTSLVLGSLIALATAPPPRALVGKFFGVEG